jgi:hypothetical protein
MGHDGLAWTSGVKDLKLWLLGFWLICSGSWITMASRLLCIAMVWPIWVYGYDSEALHLALE